MLFIWGPQLRRKGTQSDSIWNLTCITRFDVGMCYADTVSTGAVFYVESGLTAINTIMHSGLFYM